MRWQKSLVEQPQTDRFEAKSILPQSRFSGRTQLRGSHAGLHLLHRRGRGLKAHPGSSRFNLCSPNSHRYHVATL